MQAIGPDMQEKMLYKLMNNSCYNFFVCIW
jgi:hypothetical protein